MNKIDGMIFIFSISSIHYLIEMRSIKICVLILKIVLAFSPISLIVTRLRRFIMGVYGINEIFITESPQFFYLFFLLSRIFVRQSLYSRSINMQQLKHIKICFIVRGVFDIIYKTWKTVFLNLFYKFDVSFMDE